MRGLSLVRALVGALGVAVGLYGAWLLLDRQDGAQLRSVVTWLVGGVLLHDVVLAGLVLVVAALGARLLPRSARAPATVGLVVLGSLTVLAVPVLGRFGARADNPTLLDRPYVAGWLGIAAVVLLVVVVASYLRARRAG